MNTNGYKMPYSGPACNAWGEPLEEYGIAKVENIEAAHDIIGALLEALEDLASYIGVELETLDFEEEREYRATCQKAHAAIAKARNEEAQP